MSHEPLPSHSQSILRFMVAAAGSHEGVSREVVGMLVEAGLMARWLHTHTRMHINVLTHLLYAFGLVNHNVQYMPGPAPCSPSPGILPAITPLGFQFLLLSQSAQIWAFITKYLQSLQVGSFLPSPPLPSPPSPSPSPSSPSPHFTLPSCPSFISAGQRDECGGVFCVSDADQLCNCGKSKTGFCSVCVSPSLCNAVRLSPSLCNAVRLSPSLCNAVRLSPSPPTGILCGRPATVAAPGHSASERVWASVPEKGGVCGCQWQ